MDLRARLLQLYQYRLPLATLDHSHMVGIELIVFPRCLLNVHVGKRPQACFSEVHITPPHLYQGGYRYCISPLQRAVDVDTYLVYRKSGRNKTHPEITHDRLSTCNITKAESSPLLSRFSSIRVCRNMYPTHSSHHDVKRVPSNRSTNQRTDNRQTYVNNLMSTLSRILQRRVIFYKPKYFRAAILPHLRISGG